MKILISNINVKTEPHLQYGLGVAGCAGSLKMTSMTEGYLDLGCEFDRAAAGILNADIKMMIGQLVMDGFTVAVEW